MEFLSANVINTTTQIAVDANTSLAENLFNPDRYLQYYSSGYDGSTATSVVITLDQTTVLDRIAILEHNLKKFSLYYGDTTTNQISISGPTTVAEFSTNSATSHYLIFSSTIQTNKITLKMEETIVASNEKAVGFLYIGSQSLDFDRIPASSGYTPKIEPKQIVHTMSDGGTRVHTLRDKWRVSLSLSYIDESFRASLKSIYDAHDPIVFVPFGTATGWDEIIFEAVWVGGFDFYKFADNAATAKFKGSIELRETAT